MADGGRSIALIPTYNEVENIGALLLDLGKRLPDLDILVIDDNSPDGTADVVRRFSDHDPRIHLLSRPHKGGLGAAYIAGIRWALARKYDRIAQMDADFSHHPEHLVQLFDQLDTFDGAYGTRYVPGGGTSGWGLFRRLLSRGGNLYARLMLRLPYQDLTGGFTAWRREALEAFAFDTIQSRGYAFQVELKFLAHAAGLKIAEVPILFENRRFGTSKMSGRIIGEAALRVWRLRRATAPS